MQLHSAPGLGPAGRSVSFAVRQAAGERQLVAVGEFSLGLAEFAHWPVAVAGLSGAGAVHPRFPCVGSWISAEWTLSGDSLREGAAVEPAGDNKFRSEAW